jgi:hypothetical protein
MEQMQINTESEAIKTIDYGERLQSAFVRKADGRAALRFWTGDMKQRPLIEIIFPTPAFVVQFLFANFNAVLSIYLQMTAEKPLIERPPLIVQAPFNQNGK